MRFFFIYSSLTGNTRKLAEAVHQAVSPISDIYDIRKLPNHIEQEDAVFLLFYWNQRGTADSASIHFMEKLSKKRVIPLGTLGYYDDSEHARQMMRRVRQVLELRNNQVLAEFCCRGKIPVERTLKRLELPKGHSHYLNRQGIIRHLTSHFHPNEADFKRAITVVNQALNLERN